jgi:hypothetical protein
MAALFCPNCGTKNDSTATPCTKCGFKLSGVSAPKFKGTMMLSSDQSVQDLVAEHRKQQAAGKSEEAAAQRAPSETPAPSSAKPLPPRANPAKKPMADTMLGVAPQVGGFRPVTAPLPASADPSGSATAKGDARTGPLPAADATSPTMPLPASEGPDAPSAGPTGTQPLAVAQPEEVASGHAPAEKPRPADGPEAAAAPEIADLVPPARPAAARPAAARLPSGSVTPLEVVLILATCGIYGIVLLIRQRRGS